MENLKTSVNLSKNVGKLAENVMSACATLLDTLTLNPQSVGSHSVETALKMHSEFVDRIVKNIIKLKYHLIKLEQNLDAEVINSAWVEEIAHSLIETSEKLNEFLLSNNFYLTTFGWEIEGVEKMITRVLNKLPISVYAFKE